MFTYNELLGVVALGVSLLLSSLYFLQDKLLYFPQVPEGSRERYFPASQFGLEKNLEEVFFRTPDGFRLQAYVIKQNHAERSPTMLMFHGNAGNLSYRLDVIKEFFDTNNCNVVIISYRGYGKSEGVPTEEGLVTDSQAALDYVLSRSDIGKNKIVVHGQSLGGAVAIDLVSKRQSQISGLILENTFTCIDDMIDQVMPFIKAVKFLSRNKWNSLNKITTIKTPILFLVGQKDQVVPPQMSTTLYQAASSSTGREIRFFPQGSHDDCFLFPAFFEHVQEFLDKYILVHNFDGDS
eukprot:TRINITY_DN9319_c0_g1_i1.p1 TRINITY_DN9319_c0_g1~~TRINITY_DN9319_c0_g1_i1.p1  ORF type:complete len:309 (+),score=81.00 TRINITY_DN9319_c0_g1_i1:47-928(+)